MLWVILVLHKLARKNGMNEQSVMLNKKLA